MNWIKLTPETLPELERNVLLFDNWKSTNGEQMQDIRVGYLSEFTTRKSNDGIITYCDWRGTEFAFNITHWMPLPTPPNDKNQ